MKKFLYYLTFASLGFSCLAEQVTIEQVRAKWVAKLEEEERVLCAQAGISFEFLEKLRQANDRADILQLTQEHIGAELQGELVGVLDLFLAGIASVLKISFEDRGGTRAELDPCPEATIARVKQILAGYLPEAKLNNLQLAVSKTMLIELNGAQYAALADMYDLVSNIIILSPLLIGTDYPPALFEQMIIHEATHLKNSDVLTMQHFGPAYTRFCEKRADFMGVLLSSNPVEAAYDIREEKPFPYCYRGGPEWQELYQDVLQCVPTVSTQQNQ